MSTTIDERLQRRYDELTSFQIMSLNLRRLLHIMSMQSDDLDDIHAEGSNVEGNGSGGVGGGGNNQRIPDRILREQIAEARRSFEQIQHFGQHLLSTEPNSEGEAEDIIAMLEYLDAAATSSCKIVEELLEARGVPLIDDSAARYIHKIFYGEVNEQSDNDEEDKDIDGLSSRTESISLGLSEDDDEEEGHESPKQRPGPEVKLTPEEIQKQQEEMLQEEISNMATQLKQSSLHIKSTLASQNVHLDEMETLAQQNLDKTKDVTDKVTDENRRRWRKGAGRWIVFFIVLGTFVFCFLTIRLVPRRKGACLFFCEHDRSSKSSSSRRNEYDSYAHHSYRRETWEDSQNNQDAEEKVSGRKVEPKLSFCRDKDDGDVNGKEKKSQSQSSQCTRPQNPLQHDNMMGKYQNQNDALRAEDVAFVFAEENKERRFQEKLNKAKQENDSIASSRVSDGWNSDKDTNANGNRSNGSKGKIPHQQDDKSNIDDGRSSSLNYYDDDDDDTYHHDEEEDGHHYNDDDDYNYTDDDENYDDDDGDNTDHVNKSDGSDNTPNSKGSNDNTHDEDVDTSTYNSWSEYYEDGNADDDDDDEFNEDDNDDHVKANEAEGMNASTDINFDALGYDRETLVEAIRGGDEETTDFILENKPDWVRWKDDNGWQPLHESVRAGSLEIIDLLVGYYGADVNARTGGHNDGGSVLWWAIKFHSRDHVVAQYLIRKGAVSIAPGERTEL